MKIQLANFILRSHFMPDFWPFWGTSKSHLVVQVTRKDNLIPKIAKPSTFSCSDCAFRWQIWLLWWKPAPGTYELIAPVWKRRRTIGLVAKDFRHCAATSSKWISTRTSTIKLKFSEKNKGSRSFLCKFNRQEKEMQTLFIPRPS